jgi:hypothetical protein
MEELPMKLTFIFLASALALSACTEMPEANRDDEEYAIYRAILEGYGKYGGKICLHSQTRVDLGVGGRVSIKSDDYPELDHKMINDFNQHNQETVPLKPDFDLGKPGVSVILLDDYESWPCLFIHGFSRVGFNRQMKKALVYHEEMAPKGMLAGSGSLILLVKSESGYWTIEKEFSIWIS